MLEVGLLADVEGKHTDTDAEETEHELAIDEK